MARWSEKEKAEMIFFINDAGTIQYHKKCLRCKHSCKQSFRCDEVICSKYKRR
ncbi:hypothetical protein [Schinkia azotoformans]|uniref:hypothetical protein n=1 Tax=Schinkia azotoformans TaxID=1454 RepID=UPI002DB8AFC3|nr:hypothetical protein [Schinkia azotoformans]MEC1788639.1 hypothetical protein [Schinkia azotoformans]MED4419958.1 hypothetical protein [Schinkia azotoformans]